MIRLRPYKESDAETILSWCNSEEEFYKWTAGRLGNYPITPKEFNAVAELMAFTAIDDDNIVGFFTIRRPEKSHDMLRFGFVTVDSHIRGKGYGKRMLRLGLKYAFDIYGASKVTIGVFENNPNALNCYLALGFTNVTTDNADIYHIMNQNWKCLELEIQKQK